MKDLNWTRVMAAFLFPVIISVIMYQLFKEHVNFALLFFSILALVVDGLYLWDFVEDDDVDYF